MSRVTEKANFCDIDWVADVINKNKKVAEKTQRKIPLILNFLKKEAKENNKGSFQAWIHKVLLEDNFLNSETIEKLNIKDEENEALEEKCRVLGLNINQKEKEIISVKQDNASLNNIKKALEEKCRVLGLKINEKEKEIISANQKNVSLNDIKKALEDKIQNTKVHHSEKEKTIKGEYEKDLKAKGNNYDHAIENLGNTFKTNSKNLIVAIIILTIVIMFLAIY